MFKYLFPKFCQSCSTSLPEPQVIEDYDSSKNKKYRIKIISGARNSNNPPGIVSDGDFIELEEGEP